MLQFNDILRKAVGHRIATQRPDDRAVTAGRAAQPKVDTVGKCGGQRAERLGHGQRRVVGQHDPARADADCLRLRRNQTDQDGRRRTGDTLHVVMLCHPVAVITPALGMAREVQRIGDGICGIRALGHGRQVQHGIWDRVCHADQVGTARPHEKSRRD